MSDWTSKTWVFLVFQCSVQFNLTSCGLNLASYKVMIHQCDYSLLDIYRLQRSWGKVIFSQASVILFMGAGVVSQHALQVVSQHALQQVSRGWYTSMPCRFPGPHPGGKFRGIWPGGSPGPHQRGSWGGSGQEGSPGLHPRGKLEGIWPGGSPGPHPGDLLLGGCLVPGGSAPGGCGALPLGQLLLWTVCILLECIFVFFSLWILSLSLPVRTSFYISTNGQNATFKISCRKKILQFIGCLLLLHKAVIN